MVPAVFLGEEIEPNRSMDVPVDVTREAVVGAYVGACARSDEIVRASPDLSTLAAIVNPGEDAPAPLRSIVIHLIEEHRGMQGTPTYCVSRSTAPPGSGTRRSGSARIFDSLAQFYRRKCLRWTDATKGWPDLRTERSALAGISF